MTSNDVRFPDDVFKRPGPHHAFEVDMAELARVRAALDPLEELGVAEPLAQLTGRSVGEVFEYGLLEELPYRCAIGDDFGLRRYGPMLSRAELAITFGEAFYAQRDPHVHAISPFWIERGPWFPQRIARATDVLAPADALWEPPAAAWATLRAALAADDEDADDATDNRDVLVARWRGEYRDEVRRFRDCLVEIANRDGYVMTWESEQGWL